MHVEKFLLVTHGQYTKGSGLEKILGKSALSVIGLENTVVNASDIKRARYAVPKKKEKRIGISLCHI